MKYSVSDIKTIGKIDRIEIKKGKYILNIPSEANIKLGDKLNIFITEKENDLPRNPIVQLLGSVIRKTDTHCLVSAGGLLCQIQEQFDMDQTVYISIY